MNLAQRVAELFSEKPWKHNYKPTYLDTRWPNDEPKYIAKCKKCQHGLLAGETSCRVINFSKHIYTPNKPSTCPIPGPIDITDLGKALECFRGIASPENHSRLERAIKIVVTKEIDDDKGTLDRLKPTDLSDVCNLWLLYSGTPAQIWEICVLAKESE